MTGHEGGLYFYQQEKLENFLMQLKVQNLSPHPHFQIQVFAGLILGPQPYV